MNNFAQQAGAADKRVRLPLTLPLDGLNKMVKRIVIICAALLIIVLLILSFINKDKIDSADRYSKIYETMKISNKEYMERNSPWPDYSATNYPELITYLIERVPEIKKMLNYYESITNVVVHQVIYIESVPIKTNRDKSYFDDYYSIYVGERQVDHQVNWHRFKIHGQSKEIFVLDKYQTKLLKLSEWRDENKNK